ncbi:hypothetical protein K420107F6_09470 [Lactonifactor longoviformis]
MIHRRDVLWDGWAGRKKAGSKTWVRLETNAQFLAADLCIRSILHICGDIR